MKRVLTFLWTISVLGSYGQNDSMWTQYQLVNNIDQSRVGSVKISGYGQIDYNQPFGGAKKHNGKLDVHRLVMLFGHRFNDRTSFVTEIEFEHVSEVYIEQAFIKYKIKPNTFLKAGLLLIPMGIINEYHEPTTFFSVERPNMDKKIVPTTWREIGVGLTGTIPRATLRYQLYVVNGLIGFNEETATLGGENGLRGGRQKGAETIASSPNFSGKLNYYGARSMNIGLSAYMGESQSAMLNDVDSNDPEAIAQADSTVVNISMVGLDARFRRKGLELRGQIVAVKNSNTAQYNAKGQTDLGETLLGYYAEAGYNLLVKTNRPTQLIPFVRFEHYDVHFEVNDEMERNESYRTDEVFVGLNYRISTGVVFKSDVQFTRRGNQETWNQTLNMGIGFWF